MKLKLVNIQKDAQDTKSFFFETEEEVKYLPGHFFYFTLPKLKYPDPRGATRHFTLSSSPTEGKIIRFTTRMRGSGYKKTLDELKAGEEIEGEGPEGTFIFDEKEKGSHIFLAGGIGITPFRSMIKYALDKDLQIPLHLIYSNSTPEQITFRQEFQKWENENFKLDMTITKPEESKEKWKGLTGRIDENMIKKLVNDLAKPTFWICGPPGMVDGMEKIMAKLQVHANRIRTEKFTGY